MFVVHGVGQVIDDTTIIRNTNIMRDNVQSLLSKHCPHFQRDTGQRVEFFPVEWRSSLRNSVANCPLMLNSHYLIVKFKGNFFANSILVTCNEHLSTLEPGWTTGW